MIVSVKLANFKSLRDQRVDLERLTVFVGANASGKTSVLEAILYSVAAATPTSDGRRLPEELFRDEKHCDWLYSRGGSGDMMISCTTPGGTFSVMATPPSEFPPQQTDQFGQGHWTFRVAPDQSHDLQFDEAFNPASSILFLHLNAAQLAKPSYADQTPRRIAADGSGLASVLAYTALNDPDGFDALVDEMRRLIPQLKRIRFTKMPVPRVEKELVRFGNETVERSSTREYQGDAILFDFEHADNVSAHTVSEGTLMLLGLLTVLLGPVSPDILLLDDIEQGLHPLAQKCLLDVLRKIMERFPSLQILATAHSPYLLDGLEPEEVRLMTIGDDGYSVCGRLTDHPQFEKWKDEMAPGELWSLFGEKWVAERSGAT